MNRINDNIPGAVLILAGLIFICYISIIEPSTLMPDIPKTEIDTCYIK